jgi:riboflavin synthase
MFTGVIEATGTVRAIGSQAGGAVLELDTALGPELALGDSLSTNGVCLTVTRQEGPHVTMDV